MTRPPAADPAATCCGGISPASRAGSRTLRTRRPPSRPPRSPTSDRPPAATPTTRNLRRLVADLRAASSRFAALWDARGVGVHQADRKTVQHPEVGPVTLDCDVLTVPGSDLRVVAYTAAPGSEAADRLKLLAVIGTQAMSGRSG